MTAQPKRRWFRFSLRTLFVLVILLALPLGCLEWQRQIVNRRQQILQEIEVMTSSPWNVAVLERQSSSWPGQGHHEYQRVSAIRRLLGDESVVWFPIPKGADASLISRIEAAFPEAVLFLGRDLYRDSLYAPADRVARNQGNASSCRLNGK